MTDRGYRLELGQLFEGRYRIVRELGRGGFGMVYLAHQESMDRHVALKVLNPGHGPQAAAARERFLREVKIISKLRHPNTVTIHDYGENVDGVVYMVLEYVEGDTLKDILRREGAQEPIRALMLVRQIARSLAEAHRYGVVHRDLKPANIMVMDIESETDFVKVLDFGVARLLGGKDMDLTSAGLPEGERALIGTPRYMSPEQVRGEQLTPASDIYSVGLILYEMLVGEPAVQGDTTMGLIAQQLSPEPLRLPLLHALPTEVQRLVLAATHKNIECRHPSAEALADDVEQVAMRLSGGQRNLSGSIPVPAILRHTGAHAIVERDPSADWPYGGPHTPSQPQHTPGPFVHNAYVEEDFATSPQRPALSRPGEAAGGARHATGAAAAVVAPPAGPHPHRTGGLRAVGAPPAPNVAPGHGPSPGTGAHAAVQPHREFVADPTPLPLMGYQDEYKEQEQFLGVPLSDLPPPPSDEHSPFHTPEPDAPADDEAAAAAAEKPAAAATAEELSDFSLTVLQVALFGGLALVCLYLFFLVVGPLVDGLVGPGLKLVLTVVLTLAIPGLTFLGENSQRERFHVIKRPIDRAKRVCMGSAAFAFVCFALIAVMMSGTVTDELRGNPNWFMRSASLSSEPGPMATLNREVSFGLANVIERTTSAVGMYDGVPAVARERRLPPGGPAAPPAPTRPRPAAAAEEASQGEEAGREDGAPEEGSGEDGAREAGHAGTSPAPTRERADDEAPVRRGPPPTRPSADKNDYVRW